MRKFYRVILVVSLLCYFVAGSGIITFASGSIGNISTEPITTMTEPRARTAVLAYFEERKAFLTKQADDIPMAIDTLEADEVKHLQHLEANSINYLDYSIEFESINCWDNYADVVLLETISISVAGEILSEIIEHKMTIKYTMQGTIRVVSDGYIENSLRFISCCYVNPQSALELNSIAPGSSSCIVLQADSQVGEQEGADGYTKYGAEYAERTGYASFATDDWCTTFIMWCANHANISTNTIPLTGNTTDLRYWFNAYNRYYTSAAYGGSYTPQQGDIIFFGEQANDSDHVGIVVSSNTAEVQYIEGNWGAVVRKYARSLTDAYIIGYARPSYESSQHTLSTNYSLDSNDHWRTCVNCPYEYSKTAHSYSNWNSDMTMHWRTCTTCGHTKYSAYHSLYWESNISNHWRNCSVCGYEGVLRSHTYTMKTNSTHHWQECSDCGRQASYAPHNFMEDSPECYICITCDYLFVGVLPNSMSLLPHTE